MITLTCPWCGPRGHEEFAYGGDGSRRWPDLGASLEVWHRHVHERDNPKGPGEELWRHDKGCGRWLIVVRDTGDHAVKSARFAHPDLGAEVGEP